MTIVPKNIEFVRTGSVEAEQALLGAALLSGAALEMARDRVVADDFGEPIHRAIWNAICEAADAGAATVGLVMATLGSVAATDIGGQTLSQYIAKLAAEATTTVNTPHYCQAVRDNADRRRLSEAMLGIPEALAGDVPVGEVASHLMSACDAVQARRVNAAVRRMTMGYASAAAIERSSEAYRGGGAILGITTGSATLDRATGGLQGADMILLMGRPSMGKTALSLSITIGAAKAGNPVLFYSLEMAGSRLGSRVISSLCWREFGAIPYFDIDNGKIDTDRYNRMEKAGEIANELPITIEPQPHLSAAQITARARRWASECQSAGMPKGLIVVDYIGLMKASDRYSGKRNDEVTEISASLKGLAKELDVPLIALSQMNRQAEGREDKRPQLSDLRESGSLEQDADVVIGAYRPAYYLERKSNLSDEQAEQLRQEKHILEAIILKQRNGPIGVHRLFCDIGSNFIADLREDGRS